MYTCPGWRRVFYTQIRCQWTKIYGEDGPSQGANAPGQGRSGQCVTSADCASRVPYCSKLGFCHGGRLPFDEEQLEIDPEVFETPVEDQPQGYINNNPAKNSPIVRNNKNNNGWVIVNVMEWKGVLLMLRNSVEGVDKDKANQEGADRGRRPPRRTTRSVPRVTRTPACPRCADRSKCPSAESLKPAKKVVGNAVNEKYIAEENFLFGMGRKKSFLL